MIIPTGCGQGSLDSPVHFRVVADDLEGAVRDTQRRTGGRNTPQKPDSCRTCYLKGGGRGDSTESRGSLAAGGLQLGTYICVSPKGHEALGQMPFARVQVELRALACNLLGGPATGPAHGSHLPAVARQSALAAGRTCSKRSPPSRLKEPRDSQTP